MDVYNIHDLSGKIMIITGSNSGIGYESIKYFSANNAQTILACRNIKNRRCAKEKILEEHSNTKIDVLSRF